MALPSFSSKMRHAVIPGLSLSALLFLLAGCSTAEQAPTAPGTAESTAYTGVKNLDGSGLQTYARWGGYYPLAIGNRSSYTGISRYRVNDDPWMETVYGEERELTGFEDLNGRTYMVETQNRIENQDTISTYWIRYRQDRAGLYEADVSVTQPPGSLASGAAPARINPGEREWHRLAASIPPEHHDSYRRAWEQITTRMRALRALVESPELAAAARPPGSVQPDELTRLMYPLYPGQTWIIRADPLFTSEVQIHEVLRLPVGRFGAWRIRILSELFGKQDRVYMWYGRSGFLKLTADLVGVATDELGNPVGTINSQDRLLLEDLKFVDRRSHI